MRQSLTARCASTVSINSNCHRHAKSICWSTFTSRSVTLALCKKPFATTSDRQNCSRTNAKSPSPKSLTKPFRLSRKTSTFLNARRAFAEMTTSQIGEDTFTTKSGNPMPLFLFSHFPCELSIFASHQSTAVSTCLKNFSFRFPFLLYSPLLIVLQTLT
jgi:hypothetical protein